MTALLETMVTNAILATILAVIVFGVTRFVKNPPVVYWLWVLVLVKLATPPLLHLPLKLDVLEPNDDAVRVTSKEQEPPATQQSVLLRADETEPVADLSAVDIPGRQATFPAQPAGDPKEDLFTVESTVSPAGIPGDHPAGTLREAPRRWSWSLVLGSFWFLGSGLWFVLAAIRIYRFERLVRRGEPASGWLQQEGEALAHRFGLSQCPQILIVQGRVPPLLWSLQRPPIVAVPADLLDRLEPAEQVMVVAHELAHFRRRDHWFRWVEMVILGLYCWHPVAWWARRKLQEAEEQCCDAWVLWAFPEKTKSYARALLSTMEFLSASRTVLPAGASGLTTVNDVKRRFEMILQNRVDRRTSWPIRSGLILFACLALSLSARIIRAELQKSEPAKESTAAQNRSIKTDPNTNKSLLAEMLQSTRVFQTEHAVDLNAVIELVNAINESKQEHRRQAKQQKEAVDELDTLGVSVWQYEPNQLGKLNRQLPIPIRDGFRKALGGDMFSDVSRVFISKPFDEKRLQKVLLRLKSFPQLNQVSFLEGVFAREQIEKVKAALPEVKVEPSEVIKVNPAGMQMQNRFDPHVIKHPTNSTRVSRRSARGLSRSVTHQAGLALIAALKDEDKFVRVSAAQSLVRSGGNSPEALSALFDLLNETDDPKLRGIVIRTLEKISHPTEKMIRALVFNALTDQQGDVAKTAKTTLQRWGAHTPYVITALIEAMKKEDDEALWTSARSTLWSIQPASDAVVTQLIKALQDENAKVRQCATTALGSIGKN